MKTRYDLTVDYDTFTQWLSTCPVHYRFTREDEDYIVVGFFSVVENYDE